MSTNSPTPADLPAANIVRRFIVENEPVRGYWVNMEAAWQELRAHHQYPPAVRELLGETVSAAVLLAATLKFEGTLTFQLEGDGAVRLLVAQCTNDFRVRAVAHVANEAEFASGGAVLGGPEGFRRLVGRNGRIVVTVEAAERDSRYQGIVPLSGNSLAECLETYFASSEQLPTQVRLASDDKRSMGLLVQRLPGAGGVDAEEDSSAALAWADAQRAISGVTSPELLHLSLTDLLQRRFAEQDVRVFTGSPVAFECRCSQDRVEGLLLSLGIDEVRDVIREQGAVSVTCEFCHRPYRFDAADIERLFAPATPAAEVPPSLH
jgi:molecular chaperone Hsp33